MTDAELHSAQLNLSDAAGLANDMADSSGVRKLRKALDRCTPINRNPLSQYGENWFEGGSVGQPPQNPQYSVGSYPEGRPIEANFVQPPDPCQGMRETLAGCSPDQYCPSFMGQPTGEVPPFAGQPQPLDTYDSFTDRPQLIDPSRSLNDTLRQLWLRNHLQDRTQANQMPYAPTPTDAFGHTQGIMQGVSEDDFLGGRFGPGIKRMRESLAACR